MLSSIQASKPSCDISCEPRTMNCEPYFYSPPSNLELEPGQIHVWSASLDQPDSCLRHLYQFLSHDERNRAERFIFEKDRRRFAVCRGILRSIVARYLGINADKVLFKYGPNGKPALEGSYGIESLCFNLSHSEEIALYGFALDNEVGVDVEYVRDISGIELIAERIFSAGEIEIFRSLSGERKKEAFFDSWTRKEAFIKALGEGLSLALAIFDMSSILGKSARPLSLEDNTGKISEWDIQDLRPADNYAGALVVKGPIFEVKCWFWELN
jgi:4'-phosphopantetheinyl transferase